MVSKSSRKTLAVFSAALLAAGLPALYQVQHAGAEAENLQFILRVTARFALLIYLVVFVARPLRQLWPVPTTSKLLRKRRLIGVAFAGIMTVHLAFIGWLWIFVIAKPLPPLSLIGGGGAYLLMLLMLITSFDGPARALGPKNWRRLHKTGLYWIGIVFANTIIPDVVKDPTDPYYLGLTLLILAAIALRVLAHFKRTSVAPRDSV